MGRRSRGSSRASTFHGETGSEFRAGGSLAVGAGYVENVEVFMGTPQLGSDPKKPIRPKLDPMMREEALQTCGVRTH